MLMIPAEMLHENYFSWPRVGIDTRWASPGSSNRIILTRRIPQTVTISANILVTGGLNSSVESLLH